MLHLAQDLRALGWDIRVLAPHAPGAALNEVLEGVPVERFRYLWPDTQQTVCYQGGALINLRANAWNFVKLPFLLMGEVTAVARCLKRKQFDVVHSHWILPQGLTCGIMAWALDVPHVSTIHGSDILALRGAIMSQLKRFALRLADAVTVNSSVTLAEAIRLSRYSDRIVRIPMGASAPEPPNSDAVERVRSTYRKTGGPLLLFVGRLIEQKGVDDLLAAVSLLRAHKPDVTALIVGDGPNRKKLQALGDQLGISDRVTFVGWVEPARLGAYFAAADAFVGPSKQGRHGAVEGQGLTFVEAMLAGTPVIATPSGGIVDAVQHDHTGVLVREASPEDIAHAVVRIVDDPTLNRRLRENGRALAEREFTRTGSATAFSRLYTRVLFGRDRS